MDIRTRLLDDSLNFEIVRALALPQTKGMQGLVRALSGRATRRFADLILGLDREVEHHGAMAGARWLLRHFVRDYEAHGQELIPAEGPLIIAANHPASYDAMVITASIARPDFRIIIGEIPPYRYLPHISRLAIFSPPVKNTFGRMQTVRRAIRHLQDGGSLLIFPRGGIEPDPAFMPNPDGEFHKWSRSLEIFIRNVPQARVLVTAVSGVIAKRAFQHPITWFRRQRPDKQRLAFMYQIISQVLRGRELFGLRPRVTFGELLGGWRTREVLDEIESAARRTLARHQAVTGL